MLLDEDLAERYGIETPRELWAAWGAYEEEFEESIAGTVGVEAVRGISQKKADETQYDRLRGKIKIPSKLKSWGSTYPGFDLDSISTRMEDLELIPQLITPDMKKNAEALGIDLTPGMTGGQLYRAVQGKVVETQSTLRGVVDPSYQTYVGSRSQEARVADTMMRAISHNQDYSPDFRSLTNDFVQFESNARERYREEKLGVPPEVQLEIQDQFMNLMQSADDVVINDWDQLWKMRYERSYGELGWTPPEPLSPFNEDGALIGTVSMPIFKSIIDGDSFVVTSRTGSKAVHEVRLLGVRARDYGLDDDGAAADKDRLMAALEQGFADGDSIYLVRQPDPFGNVDIYGRELAWLWIGDKPYYFPEEMLPTRDPSGTK